jgi:hypothetical protein
MSEATRPKDRYFLGHSDAKIRRLQTQATILRPITERLFRSAGIRPGMRVLELGTGAGDAAMPAAEPISPPDAPVEPCRILYEPLR